VSERARTRHVRLLAALCACAFAVALATAANAAAQQGRGDEPVDELLEEFPLGTETVRTAPERATAPGRDAPPPAVEVPVEVSDGDSIQSWLLVAGIVLALAAAVGVASMLVLRARRRLDEPPWTIPDLAVLRKSLAISNEEWNKLQRADTSTRRRPPVTDVAQGQEQQQSDSDQDRGIPAEATDREAAHPSEHTGVVERVSAILQAAEAAAAAIREEATVGGAEIRRQAERDGQAHLAKVKEEAAQIRNEAEEAAKEARSGAEAYGAAQRREAEQRVQQVLDQAEAQARATRQAAEEMARQIEGAAREREENLRAQMQPLETSLRRALDAFRGISAQLEELLESGQGEDETLVEALSGPVQQRSEDWEETGSPPPRSNG
jgi:hypothetical protein